MLLLQFLIWSLALAHGNVAIESDPSPSMSVNLKPYKLAWEFMNKTKRLIPVVTDYKPEFEATCTAKYPIRWNLSGHIVSA